MGSEKLILRTMATPFSHEFTQGSLSKHYKKWPKEAQKAVENPPESLNSLAFNIFDRTDEQLLGDLYTIFDRVNTLKVLSIRESNLKQFVLEIKALYRDNSFHNFRHA